MKNVVMMQYYIFYDTIHILYSLTGKLAVMFLCVSFHVGTTNMSICKKGYSIMYFLTNDCIVLSSTLGGAAAEGVTTARSSHRPDVTSARRSMPTPLEHKQRQDDATLS